MKTSHKVSIGVVLILGCLLLYWGATADEKLSANNIYDRIEQGESAIDLRQLTTFEWAEAAAFGPYTTSSMIEESLDIELSLLNGYIDVLETQFLLLFVHEGKVVDKLYLSREYGDYTVENDTLIIIQN